MNKEFHCAENHHQPGEDYPIGEALFNNVCDALHEGLVTADGSVVTSHETNTWGNDGNDYKKVLRLKYSENSLEYENVFNRDSFFDAEISFNPPTLILPNEEGERVQLQFYFPDTRRVFEIHKDQD